MINSEEQSPRSAPETTMAYILYIGAVLNDHNREACRSYRFEKTCDAHFSGKLSMTEWIHGKTGGTFLTLLGEE